jgi:hypothetical protein
MGGDSVVGEVAGYGLDSPGIEPRLGWGRNFSRPSRPARGAHTASYAVGIGLLPGVRGPGRDISHLLHLTRG